MFEIGQFSRFFRPNEDCGVAYYPGKKPPWCPFYWDKGKKISLPRARSKAEGLAALQRALKALEQG